MADYRKLRETLMDMAMSTSTHIPVLLEETLEALAVQPGGRYIDGTVGGGGHAAAILERSSPGGQLLGIDADPEAVKVARARLAAYRRSVLLVNENLVNLKAIGIKYDFMPVHGILFDLGLSSLQLDSRRGFSFQHDAPLDMRLSPHQEITAADIINTKSLAELERLLRAYGEEVYARRIARHIVQERPIKTTLELARVVERAVGGRKGKLHPATKTFQALRLAVNRELEHLEVALNQAIDLLGFEGRLVVISYHSLEDRIVKQFMRQESTDCICPPETPACVCGHTARLKLITRKVITPSPAEVKLNPRSRSARLRVAERIGTQGIGTQGENDKIMEKLYFSTGVKADGWRKPAVLKKIKAVFYAA